MGKKPQAEKNRRRSQAEGGAGRQASRRKRDRVREAARKVIDRRRAVLEELAKR